MKTSTLLYLITGLSLAVLPACGDPPDPSTEENNKSTTVMDMGVTPGMDMTVTPDMPGTTPDMPGTTPDMPGTTPDMPGTTPDMPDLGECAERALYEGQMGNPNPKKGGGGAFTIGTASYEADSGLSAVVAAIKAGIDAGTIVADDEDTADVREDELVLAAGEELQITGAIVTSTSFENDDGANFTYARRITFQDQGEAVLMFLAFDSPDLANLQTDKNGDPVTLKVGDKVNFKVTKLTAFGGSTPQIGGISEVEKVGAGEDVGVMEKTGEDLTKEDFQKMVRVHGTIESAGSGCGGSSQCFDLKHGDKTTTLRISDGISRLPMMGDCITYVGPASAFPGPFADDPTVQVDAVNFTWYRGPFAE